MVSSGVSQLRRMQISQDKRSDIAVDVALLAGVNLVIAGKIDPGKDTRFYNERIALGLM